MQAKCERYLPMNAGEIERFGEMEIHIVKLIQCDGYQVRDILLKVHIIYFCFKNLFLQNNSEIMSHFKE